jgi:hypothetical protein
MFGYSIAIIGMLYYKLGDKELKPWIAEAGRKWAEFGATRPAARKLLLIFIFIVVFFTLIGGLGSNYAPEYIDPKAYLESAKNAVHH